MQVGSLIALLAEEGDDLASITAPEPSTSSAPAATPAESNESASNNSSSAFPTPAATKAASPAHSHGDVHPTHSHTLLPSVLRLLMLEGISDTSSIKATGPRGHLTKGDVLAHLGRIKTATGSEKPDDAHASHGAPAKADGAAKAKAEAPTKEMTALEFRQLIAAGLGQAIAPAAAKPAVAGLSTFSAPLTQAQPLCWTKARLVLLMVLALTASLLFLFFFFAGFDSVLDEYLPAAKRSTAKTSAQKAAETVTVTGPTKVTFDNILDL